ARQDVAAGWEARFGQSGEEWRFHLSQDFVLADPAAIAVALECQGIAVALLPVEPDAALSHGPLIGRPITLPRPQSGSVGVLRIDAVVGARTDRAAIAHATESQVLVSASR